MGGTPRHTAHLTSFRCTPWCSPPAPPASSSALSHLIARRLLAAAPRPCQAPLDLRSPATPPDSRNRTETRDRCNWRGCAGGPVRVCTNEGADRDPRLVLLFLFHGFAQLVLRPPPRQIDRRTYISTVAGRTDHAAFAPEPLGAKSAAWRLPWERAPSFLILDSDRARVAEHDEHEHGHGREREREHEHGRPHALSAAAHGWRGRRWVRPRRRGRGSEAGQLPRVR